MATEKLPIKPTYRILANSKDITDVIADRLKDLNYTDETGFDSDTLTIEIANNDPTKRVKKPPKGAELELYIGYDGRADLKGLFVADEIERGGPPTYMTIRARATPYDRSKGGKTTLQDQKRRIWKKGTKIGDMVAKIAKEHGMEPAVSKSLKNVPLPTIDQSNESDINMLVRIGKKYDAMVKPAAGKLIFAKRGESKTISGEQLPTVVLTPGDVTSWRIIEASRDSAGTVVAYYRVPRSSTRREVKIGEGEPVYRIKQGLSTKEMAVAAARSEYAKRKRDDVKLSITMSGRHDLLAEAPLVLAGWEDDVETTWLIKRVSHSLSGGWQCNIEAELPDDTDTAKAEDVAT